MLGPLLFDIFLNDLLLTNLRSIVCNFADDKTPYCCGETTKNVIENLPPDQIVVLGCFGNNPAKISVHAAW